MTSNPARRHRYNPNARCYVHGCERYRGTPTGYFCTRHYKLLPSRLQAQVSNGGLEEAIKWLEERI